ncbi:MAG: recombination protein RecR [Clostridia bacterium]|jgi:recombination protein RecR|nr:recombination protein RecR [Clostridia bacterium]MBO5842240.1 recombination protein RecR [Clostridia bacterium]MBO7295718.1 recombination protein RecR [Clostridia bacterium]
MAEYMVALRKLEEQFARLEGVGRKSATRMAFAVLEMEDAEAEEFAKAIIEAKQSIHLCPVCQNLTDRELCPICSDLYRDQSIVCVVTDVKAVMAMEKVKDFRGTYHVLHGVISPMNRVTPEQLKIKELLARLEDDTVKEIILATNADIEGNATAMYLAHLIKPLGIKVTRLAYGIPVGADLNYADEYTLMQALEGRRDM